MLMALLVTSAFSGSTPSASLSRLKLLISHADSSQLISMGPEMHLGGAEKSHGRAERSKRRCLK